MGKMKNTFDALIVNLGCFIDLNGNVAGGALLANTFYKRRAGHTYLK